MEATQQKPSEESSVEERLTKAVAHPLRHKAFTILVERVASPNEIAIELDEDLSRVSYHVRVLRDELNLIELVEIVPKRGTVEHRYVAVKQATLHDHEWAKLSMKEREDYSMWAAQLFISDMARAIAARTFDKRLNRHMTRSLPEVDEQGWNDIADLFDGTFERIDEIRIESAGRAAEDGTDLFPATAGLLLFERPPHGAKHDFRI